MEKQAKKLSKGTWLRKWSRLLHRDLSYVLTGALLVYLISGILMNHRKELNLNYRTIEHEYQDVSLKRSAEDYTRDFILAEVLPIYDLEEKYAQQVKNNDGTISVILKGGSSLLISPEEGRVLYTEKKLKWLSHKLTRLHYNPSKAWTIFSDIFVIAMVIVVVTGLIMVKGKRGIAGRGLIYLLIGVIVPLLFMLI